MCSSIHDTRRSPFARASNLRRKVVLLIAFLVVFVILGKLYNWRMPTFLSIPERFNAEVAWESYGRDGIRCVKLLTNEARYLSAVSQLQLENISGYPKWDNAPANCTAVQWWNINFPSMAQHYRLSDNGSERVLTAYSNGYLYYVYEIR